MNSRTTSTPPDFSALIQQLITQLGGGVVETDTPQLGRVGFARPAELYAAMNYLSLAQAAANGVATAGVITIEHDRGLWPMRRCV